MDIKDTYKYQREWQKENYKRIPVNVPRTWDEPAKERAKSIGKSTNEYIRDLIDEDMKQNYKDWNIIKEPKKPDNKTGQNPDTTK